MNRTFFNFGSDNAGTFLGFHERVMMLAHRLGSERDCGMDDIVASLGDDFGGTTRRRFRAAQSSFSLKDPYPSC